MDSTAHTSPRHSYIINELQSRVTHGFDSPKSLKGLRNNQQTPVTADAWIRQPRQTLGTQIMNEIAVTGDALIRQPTLP